MSFELSAKEAGEMQFLVAKNIKGGPKSTYLDGTVGFDPELILRLWQGSGFVGRKCLLARAETYEELIGPDHCVLRLTASRKRLKRSEILSATAQNSTKHFIGTKEGAETANILGRPNTALE